MTAPLMAKLTRMIDHRIAVARRWFRLRDTEAVVQFVQADPDVQALLANPVIERQALRLVIAEIIDGVNIARHRQRFGDEFVDHVLAVSARLDAE